VDEVLFAQVRVELDPEFPKNLCLQYSEFFIFCTINPARQLSSKATRLHTTLNPKLKTNPPKTPNPNTQHTHPQPNKPQTTPPNPTCKINQTNPISSKTSKENKTTHTNTNPSTHNTNTNPKPKHKQNKQPTHLPPQRPIPLSIRPQLIHHLTKTPLLQITQPTHLKNPQHTNSTPYAIRTKNPTNTHTINPLQIKLKQQTTRDESQTTQNNKTHT
jgi:hypothetical protein